MNAYITNKGWVSGTPQISTAKAGDEEGEGLVLLLLQIEEHDLDSLGHVLAKK